MFRGSGDYQAVTTVNPVPPFQGGNPGIGQFPRAMPWTVLSRPFRARTNARRPQVNPR